MAKDNKPDYTAAIEEMRGLAREPFDKPEELIKLRHRITVERDRSHRKIIDTFAKAANVDLQPIYDEARRRNAVKRRYVTETLTRLEAQAKERATAQMRLFHQTRAKYLKTFGSHLAAQQGKTELKFRNPFHQLGEARAADCNVILGGFSAPDPGTYEASAEIMVSPDTPGMWLFPRLFIDTGDCDDTSIGRTHQELTYQMAPPAQSFAVNSVRVDLLANGVASCVFGDLACFHEPNPYYEHSLVQLDVLFSQLVDGEWQTWPLVSDRVFSGTDEYVTQIRALVSGQTYPANVIVRKPEVGGGELLCYLLVTTRTQALGTDGRMRLDFGQFNVHGIFVGGVALIGSFV
jgi:hypothetical protein